MTPQANNKTAERIAALSKGSGPECMGATPEDGEPGRFAQVKEEPAQRAADTNGAEHPARRFKRQQEGFRH